MTQATAKNGAGCLWVVIGFAILIVIVGSCHPTRDSGSNQKADSSSAYSAFDTPQQYKAGTQTSQKSVNIRKGPGTEFEILEQVPVGTRLTALGSANAINQDVWLAVQTDKGEVGYAKQGLLTSATTDTKEVAVTFPTSFNCLKAISAAEHLICADKALADSDLTMADLYKPLLKSLHGADHETLIREQKAWQSQRNKCATEALPRTCLSEQYQVRVLTLQAAGQHVDVPSPDEDATSATSF